MRKERKAKEIPYLWGFEITMYGLLRLSVLLELSRVGDVFHVKIQGCNYPRWSIDHTLACNRFNASYLGHSSSLFMKGRKNAETHVL